MLMMKENCRKIESNDFGKDADHVKNYRSSKFGDALQMKYFSFCKIFAWFTQWECFWLTLVTGIIFYYMYNMHIVHSSIYVYIHIHIYVKAELLKFSWT